MKSIIGYDFNADTYCADGCILVALGEISQEQMDAATYVTDLTDVFGESTVEDALGVIASRRGITRMDERSYDSGDFPKVVFHYHESPDYCPMCAGCLAPLDGFDPADYATTPDDDDTGPDSLTDDEN